MHRPGGYRFPTPIHRGFFLCHTDCTDYTDYISLRSIIFHTETAEITEMASLRSAYLLHLTSSLLHHTSYRLGRHLTSYLFLLPSYISILLALYLKILIKSNSNEPVIAVEG